MRPRNRMQIRSQLQQICASVLLRHVRCGRKLQILPNRRVLPGRHQHVLHPRQMVLRRRRPILPFALLRPDRRMLPERRHLRLHLRPPRLRKRMLRRPRRRATWRESWRRPMQRPPTGRVYVYVRFIVLHDTNEQLGVREYMRCPRYGLWLQGYHPAVRFPALRSNLLLHGRKFDHNHYDYACRRWQRFWQWCWQR